MARQRSAVVDIFQRLMCWIARVGVLLIFRIRIHGLNNYPAEDGFLICANHQSHLDPVMLGVSFPRPVNFLARDSLFKFGPLGTFLKWNDTIPIDREGSGIGGLKETLRRLKRHESVLMFPEGTRSPDGQLQSLKSGFCPIARRSKAPLLPVAVTGTFEAWPRNRWFPRSGAIEVVFGRPIQYEQYAQLTDPQIVEMLQEKMAACLLEAQRRWQARQQRVSMTG